MANLEIFGQYALKQLLASGQAADVWLASRGETEVIIKRILPPWSSDLKLRKIFLEIVKDTIGLKHPNLVSILDFGQEDDYLYVTFEKVEGIFLRQILQAQQPLSKKQVLALTAGILSGLSFLHQTTNPYSGEKITHCEVSPSNILVDSLGRPRIVDMGFSRVVLEAGLPGKPAIPDRKYIAPEVIEGTKSDVQSDVYGIGVILNELSELLEPPAIEKLNEVKKRAYTKDRGNRYKDATAVLKDLLPILESNNISVADAILDDFSDWSSEIKLSNATPASSYVNALHKRYQIIAELGRGAMGIVLHARDKTLNEELAIKILNQDRLGKSHDLERFHQELKLARQVNHPNVARVYHLEQAPGFVYYTLEYVKGLSLDVHFLQNTLDPNQAVEIFLQLAQGLDAIHKAGVVHRDIKPANIILQQEGRAVIMDFGVAKKQDEDTGITVAGATVGTPAYMAPEQLIANNVDQRADLYAFGVMMYEALTGIRPHNGNTCIALYMQKTEAKHEAARKLNPKISRKLDSLIQSLLEAKPEKRIQNSEELIEKLKYCI